MRFVHALMKAYVGSDRNGDEGTAIVVFAESAGKAKAYVAGTDTFCDYGFTGIRINRCAALDPYYKGRREMDWSNMEDRVAMVRYADFECSSEMDWDSCDCEHCEARQWCGRYEMMVSR